MARGSFKRVLLGRIQLERQHRGVSGASLFSDRSDSAPNPKHMVAFSSDDLPALRMGRRHHGPGGPGAAPVPPAAPAAAPAAPAAPAVPAAPAPGGPERPGA